MISRRFAPNVKRLKKSFSLPLVVIDVGRQFLFSTRKNMEPFCVKNWRLQKSSNVNSPKGKSPKGKSPNVKSPCVKLRNVKCQNVMSSHQERQP